MPACLLYTGLKGKEEEEGKDKAGEGKPVVNPLEDKEPVMHPPQPVPVRLDSEPLESASSQGSAEGQEKKADKSQVILVLCYCSVDCKRCAG